MAFMPFDAPFEPMSDDGLVAYRKMCDTHAHFCPMPTLWAMQARAVLQRRLDGVAAGAYRVMPGFLHADPAEGEAWLTVMARWDGKELTPEMWSSLADAMEKSGDQKLMVNAGTMTADGMFTWTVEAPPYVEPESSDGKSGSSKSRRATADSTE